MLIHKTLIQRVIVVFGELIVQLNPNDQSLEQFDETVNQTIQQLSLVHWETEIVQAFFDTYIGILMTDRELATEFVNQFMAPVH